jgi:hypothetical protein
MAKFARNGRSLGERHDCNDFRLVCGGTFSKKIRMQIVCTGCQDFTVPSELKWIADQGSLSLRFLSTYLWRTDRHLNGPHNN